MAADSKSVKSPSPALNQPAATTKIQTGDYGLRGEILSPMETLAQSVSTIAPTSTPAATIPLVAALAGNGTWLAYFLATIAILLVAWCVSRFAKYSASPGSLYTYASMILPPWMGAVAAWSLLLAYVATASSVIGGFYNFANLLAVHFAGREFSTVALALARYGSFHMDRLAGRQDFRSLDAVDRSRVPAGDPRGHRAGSDSARLHWDLGPDPSAEA